MKKIIKACRFSLNGLKVVLLGERAFRQELILVCVGFVALGVLNLSGLTKCLLGFSLMLILIAEMVNTAIENIVDRIGPELHPLSRNAKDIGSAVVFLTILSVVLLWIFVLFII